MFTNPRRQSRLKTWEDQARNERLGTPEERWERRKRLLIRLAIVCVTVLALSLVSYAGGGNWGPPFAFREGEVYPRDIRVKIDFSVVDQPATQLRREQAAAAVHPILDLDPEPLRELQLRLTQLLLAAHAGSFDQLDPEMVRFWSLSEDELRALSNTLRNEPERSLSFLAVLPSPSAPPNPIPAGVFGVFGFEMARYPIHGENDLRARVEAAFAPLLAGGILDDDVRKSEEALARASHLTVVRPDGSRFNALPDEVLKSKLIGDPRGDRGPLYLQFAKAFQNEKIAERLYRLVVGSDRRPIRLPGTLKYNPTATEEARAHAAASVPEQRKEYKRGAPLIEQGQPIQEKDIPLLREEHRAFLASLTWDDHLRRWFALLVIIAGLTAFVSFYVAQTLPDLADNVYQLVLVCGMITGALGLAILLNQPPWYGAILPLTMTALILRMAYNQAFAWIVSMCMSLVITLSLGTDLARHFLVLISGSTVAVLALRSVRTRSQLAWVGVAAGLGYAIMTVAAGLLTDQPWSLIGLDATRRFLWGFVSGLFLTGLLPVIEWLFGILTDMSLLELGDMRHPLLQELIQRAPGTYTHSMTVALLAETAAKAIGANSLLARVGSYFHDIGKMCKPDYFVENQSGTSRHASLAPGISALIIIGHVKDGVELAQRHRLPQAIIDFIQQHHGNTLVEYFYQEALRQHENGNGSPELETTFRYPGPRPQTKEIGIVMLADAVEGASRALNEPGPSGLRKLVHDIMLKRLMDGQFDECGLTLSELRIIEESLSMSLIAMYHARVKYPDQKQESKTG
ncbi:MAG: HDIG domain-containing protein [Gemmatales bacterium]|nr:HDIG domain-containing protein [Gemmatales bacterium]MDW8386420.1 HDIG domain-containing protein [Gemmatales bacterium]